MICWQKKKPEKKKKSRRIKPCLLYTSGKGRFVLNGVEYELYCNDGANHLHGGKEGFDKKVWTADVEDDALCMRYTSPNGEEGYPGTLCTEVRYRLDDENRFCVEYQAVCDTDTVLNLTNHSYFNLNGHDAGTLEQHKVQILADFYTENKMCIRDRD